MAALISLTSFCQTKRINTLEFSSWLAKKRGQLGWPGREALGWGLDVGEVRGEAERKEEAAHSVSLAPHLCDRYQDTPARADGMSGRPGLGMGGNG